ncbi:MmgE/PrpD family protein [Alteraurantiacibacter palmitatis]|uniref:MmgE/PrpD family protein n=1 Tax=Alteraurantiacibacter palmitatis TaxID=2054628 RepID=A0ABV7E6F6_9SPHN
MSEQVAALIAGVDYAALPDAVLRAGKLALLDATGVMLAASGLSPEARAFARMAQGMGGGPCAILGTRQRAAAPMAALANGALAHALDFEDAFDLAPGHPNGSLVPALIALAQMQGAAGDPVDGQRFLAALVAGCEMSCRMGLALRRKMEEGGWYPPPILAGFGAVAGAAHLLRLNPRQMADAFSLALCSVTMPGEIKYSQRTTIRAIREAFPAQAAVQAVLLAQAGVAGFEEPLEGRAGFYALYAGGQFDPDILLAPPDGAFWIEQLTFKPWPSCRGTHPFIEMALALQAEHGFTVQDIAAIRAGIGPMQVMLAEPHARKAAPEVAIDAKFSVPFCTALALAKGGVGLDSFAPEMLADPAVLALASRVTCHVPDGAENWRGDAGALEIALADGTVLSARRDAARGAPHNPLAEGEVIDKFVACAARAARPLADSPARELARQILSLEKCADAGALLA